MEFDYDALLNTAAVAYASKMRSIKERLAKLNAADFDHDNTSRRLEAEWLADDAKALAIAASTYSALVEGLSRDDKSFINVPKSEA